jgi:ABC-2 type transport system permease protein
VEYEIRRAIARKKVLSLVAFSIILGIVPYYALSAAGATLIPNNTYPFIWVVGIFALGPLFLNFTAILIAAGAMSEEYEQGTAELLLSKPIRRSDYFIGKFLGGYILFLSILLLIIFLSVTSAFTFFGTQSNLDLIPGLFLAQAFSSLLFYSLAFMLGELIRRTSLAYIFSSAIFFSSFIISSFMGLIYTLTGQEIYKTIQIYLPTSPANSLPIQYAFPQLPQTLSPILGFISNANSVPTIELSIQILLVYTIAAIVIAASYFLRADITRKLN